MFLFAVDLFEDDDDVNVVAVVDYFTYIITIIKYLHCGCLLFYKNFQHFNVVNLM